MSELRDLKKEISINEIEDGFINQVRDRPVRLGRLQSQGPVYFRLEINSRSFRGGIHNQIVAL